MPNDPWGETLPRRLGAMLLLGCPKRPVDRPGPAPAPRPAGACTDPAAIDGLAPRAWTWVDFPESRCGNGGSTGVGVSRSPSGDPRVLVYLEGGGACYDERTCALDCSDGQRGMAPRDRELCARNLDAVDARKFQMVSSRLGNRAIFDRSDPGNPFRDWSFVYVPYCTGDFHSGSRTAPYGIHHEGATNMGRFLERLGPTFCDAPHVVLSGSSAGGFGAVFNYAQVAAAFPDARVDLVDDAGPPMSPQHMPLQVRMREVWGASAPPGCEGCREGWDGYLPWISRTWPRARISLVTPTLDPIIVNGFDFARPPEFRAAIGALADDLDRLPNVRVFVIDEVRHVSLGDDLGAVTSMGTTLSDFLQRQVDDDEDWRSVRPRGP